MNNESETVQKVRVWTDFTYYQFPWST